MASKEHHQIGSSSYPGRNAVSRGLDEGIDGPSIGKSSRKSSSSSSSTMRVSPPSEPTREAIASDLKSGSPGTPPKKLWERQYRSFLSKRKEKHTVAPALPVLKGRQKSGGEASVRGGSLFGSVFRGGPPPPPGDALDASVGRQRSRSDNDLDGTRRRGNEKAYRSPKSPSNHKRFVESRARKGSNSANDMDLDGSRRNGTMSPRIKRPEIRANDLSSLQTPIVSSSQEIPQSLTRLQPRIGSSRTNYSVQSSLMGTSPTVVTTDILAESTSTTPPISGTLPIDTPPSLRKIIASDLIPSKPADPDKPQSQSSAMKKAFTEFHSSSQFGKDAAAAFLGEDNSFHGQSLFYAHKEHMMKAPSSTITKSKSQGTLALDTVHEGVRAKSSERMLKAFQGVDVWQNGRRYLIGPAALSSSPAPVLELLSGKKEPMSLSEGSISESAFGAIMLGKCTLAFGGDPSHEPVRRKAAALLVLRQNYLLEYDPSLSSLVGTPRGYIHLQLSIARKHPDMDDTLELRYFSSPCSQTDQRTLLIRIDEVSDRDNWIKCLNRAARLQINDMYVYDDEKPLGEGQYSAVYAARRLESPRDVAGGANDRALKVFDKSMFWRLVSKGRERADTLVRETAVQASLTATHREHGSFLCVLGFFETSEHVALELELTPGTDLFGYISSKGPLGEPEAARITVDLLRCMQLMNEVGVAHRDIKPANVLMCSESPEGPRVKVCDFGMATFCGVDGKVRGRCGTPGYVAPEIFHAGVHGGYRNKVDIFSAGVTLYVMLFGYEPFYGESDAELVEANKKAELKLGDEQVSITDLAKQLISAMMHPDPQYRISVKDALNHPWINCHVFETRLALAVEPVLEERDDACMIS